MGTQASCSVQSLLLRVVSFVEAWWYVVQQALGQGKVPNISFFLFRDDVVACLV